MNTRRRLRKRKHTVRNKRKQRGGIFPKLRNNAIKWPPNEGCELNPVTVTLQRGDLIDRFGPTSGSYVSPIGNTARRIGNLLSIPESNTKNKYTYKNRALPYAGVNSAGFKNNTVRKTLYNNESKKGANALGYHQYEILQDIDNCSACKAASAFDTPGGAIQIKLPMSIQELIDNGRVKEIATANSNIPPYN